MPLSQNVILQKHEIELISDKLKKRGDIRNYLLFKLSLLVPISSKHILNLKVTNLLFEVGVLTGCNVNGKSYIFCRDTISMFDDYFSIYPFLLNDSDNFIFFQLNAKLKGKKSISRQMFWKYTKDRCNMINISDNLSTDSFRRSWAHYAYQSGMGLDEISYHLGFKNITSIINYLSIGSEGFINEAVSVNLF